MPIRIPPRIWAHVQLLLADHLLLPLWAGLLLFGLVAGYRNASAGPEVRELIQVVRSERVRLERLLREAGGEGLDARPPLDGVAAESAPIDLERTQRRLEADRHYGSLLGVVDAMFGSFATAIGVGCGAALGAVSIGREFEYRTWAHVILGGPRRRAVLAKVGACLALYGTALLAISGAATIGAAAAQVAGGHLLVGWWRPDIGVRLVAVLVTGTVGVLLGMVGAFLATRALTAVALAGVILLVDGFLSVNLASWQAWLLSGRIASVAALWRAVPEESSHAPGRTTSAIWWIDFPQAVGPWLEGLIDLVAAAALIWCAVRLLARHVPVSVGS
jgi:hypothetical protein